MWRIELFDGLRAQRDEIIIARFRTQKTAALLAYLAFFPVPHTRDFLIELLWPAASLESGRNNLRLALASLRRQFEPPGTPQGSVLITGRVWVQFNPQAFSTDVQQFEALLRQAHQTPDAADDLLEKALNCYRGPLLRGYYEDWIPVEEQRLENLMLGAARRLIQFCEAQNDLVAAQYHAHKAAPLSHDAEMRTKAHRLLRGNHEKSTAKIKKAKTPQVLAPRVPVLPARLTRYFGRQSELAHIQNFLDDPQARLLTIAGPGGCGKSRLALESAWNFHEQRPSEALCFVPLADVRDFNNIAAAIGQALRLPPSIESIQSTIERVIQALRQSETRLLVLDNFEQLLPGGEMVVRRILEAVPTLHCLITSRVVLQITGEQELHLTALELPPPEINEPASLQEFAAVRLFVDRARARRPDFQVTPHNAASLGELLRRLDGLPLAIEICAARSNVLSPHQMLLQLQSGGELAGEARLGLSSRQSSLRAAFEWSYDLLTANLQYVLRHLSLFRGGFSLEAAQAVCVHVPALSSLAFLRDASLVQSQEIIGATGHSEMRYSLLDTVLNFASDKLQPDESFAAHERHSLFYVSLAETTRNMAFTLVANWQSTIFSEIDNLSAALEWSVDRRLDLALRLLMALQLYWMTHDPARGKAMLENVISQIRPQYAAPHATYARILRECGEMAVRQTDLSTGKRWLEESLMLNHALRDNAEEAGCLTSLGLIAMEQGEADKAAQNLEAAATIYRAHHDATGLAWALRHQGVLARRSGDLIAARLCLESV